MKRHHNNSEKEHFSSPSLTSRKRPLPSSSPSLHHNNNNNMCSSSPSHKTASQRMTSPPRKSTTSSSLFSSFSVKSLLHLLIVVTLSSSVFMVVRYHSITTSALSVVEMGNRDRPLLRIPKNHRRASQTVHERRKRPPKHDNAGMEVHDVAAVSYSLYQDSSLAHMNVTNNWKTTDTKKSDFCGMQAQSLVDSHGFVGAPLNNASTVVITSLLSPLGVALALRLHLECHVEKIVGLDHLLPNTRHYRMKKMDSYALLQRHLPKLPKLVIPELGIPMQEILQQHRPTHVVHIVKNNAEDASYLELVTNMQDVIYERVSGDNKKSNFQMPHLVYITTKHPTSLYKAQAIQLVASTFQRTRDLSGSMVGLQLPLLYGGDFDEHSKISRLTMEYLNGTTTTSIDAADNDDSTFMNQEFLFVEDAVDAVVAAMQLEPPGGFATVDVPTETTLAMIRDELAKVVTGTTLTDDKKTVSFKAKSTKKKINNDKTNAVARYWLGWSPTTHVQEGVATLVSLHLSHKYPYGNIPQKLNVPTPLQRNMFPCASECARSKACKPSVFDETTKVSRRLTRGCKFVIYTVDLWKDVEDLPSSGEQSDDPVENAKWCRVAFVSNASPLVAKLASNNNKTTGTTDATPAPAVDPKTLESLNGKVQWKNWTLVFVNGDASAMSEAEYTLLKMSPKRFFSDSVARAMYVQPNRFPVPPYESLAGYFKTLEPRSREAGRTKEYRSGVNIFRFVPKPAKKARRVIFSSLEASFPNVPPKSPVGVYVQDLVQREGIRPVQERLSPQVTFYSYVAHFVQMNPRRPEPEIRSTIYKEFPFQWLKTAMVVHDLREEESRQLRCDWYDEHLFWSNSHLEDLSLAYVLAKRRIMGRHAMEPEDEPGWLPIMDTPAKSEEEEPERLTTADDAELFLRILPKPRTSAAAN